jgi:hypothetical protein
MTGYEVEIIECSKELTARERIMMKDTSDDTKLEEATSETALVITPVAFAVLQIHNENSKDNKDYKNFIVVDKDGTRYYTGSESFWSTFRDIWSDMNGEEENWGIKAYQVPSKNRSGKNFITCSII